MRIVPKCCLTFCYLLSFFFCNAKLYNSICILNMICETKQILWFSSKPVNQTSTKKKKIYESNIFKTNGFQCHTLTEQRYTWNGWQRDKEIKTMRFAWPQTILYAAPRTPHRIYSNFYFAASCFICIVSLSLVGFVYIFVRMRLM